ncbi:MAG TPA: hypothetical protein VGD64_14940 [Acidisarcina sp.]
MNGDKALTALKKKLGVKTDRALAHHIGVTEVTIQNWKRTKDISALQLAGLVSKAMKSAERETQLNTIQPVVEFYRIQKYEQKARSELFSEKVEGANPHPYRSGLKKELEESKGVYVFFDSRGSAIYAGKAKRQSLWLEMNSAFNRDRGEVQQIKRVRHPENRVKYRPPEEKSRQIGSHVVPLHELASYFSAYKVSDGMINELEALLVRSFANDLLNKNMERFDRQRKKRSVGKRRSG